MALHSSVTDLSTRALLVSILAQRSDALREAGPLKCRCVHTPEHLPPPPFFQSTPATPRRASIDSLHTPSFNMSRGFLPPDRGSMDTEIPASTTGIVTPSSAHQLVSSSGRPADAQLDPVIATSRLTKVQTEEIFLLSCEVQTLCMGG